MKNILLLTPNSDTFTNPTMTTLFHLLNERGVNVYLFGPEQQPACPGNIKNVNWIPSKFKLNLFRNPKNYASHWKSYRDVKRILNQKKIKTVMAVDPLGLIIGGRVKRFLAKDIHLSYLSFEIFFKDELLGYYQKMKEKEIYYSKYIDSLLIQDEKRKQLLFQENKFDLPDEKVALVPVSPMKIEINEKLDLHKKFGIAKDKKLVVYSGSVGEWCGTKAIIGAFGNGYWNNNFHLIFHMRKPITDENEFYADLKRLDDDDDIPFTLHPNPFDSFEALSVFLSGFDVALALYYPNNQNPYYGMNMKEIGLSSGKFSTYMMLGLPTVVTECEIYNFLNGKYNFGAILQSDMDLGISLEQCAQIEKLDVLRLYNQELDPIIGLDKMVKRIIK